MTDSPPVEQLCVRIVGGDAGDEGGTLSFCGQPGHDGVHDESHLDLLHPFLAPTAAPAAPETSLCANCATTIRKVRGEWVHVDPVGPDCTEPVPAAPVEATRTAEDNLDALWERYDEARTEQAIMDGDHHQWSTRHEVRAAVVDARRMVEARVRASLPSNSDRLAERVELLRALTEWAVWTKGQPGAMRSGLYHRVDGDAPREEEWAAIGAALASATNLFIFLDNARDTESSASTTPKDGAFLIDGALQREDGADWTPETAQEAEDAILDFISEHGWGFGGTIGVPAATPKGDE